MLLLGYGFVHPRQRKDTVKLDSKPAESHLNRARSDGRIDYAVVIGRTGWSSEDQGWKWRGRGAGKN